MTRCLVTTAVGRLVSGYVVVLHCECQRPWLTVTAVWQLSVSGMGTDRQLRSKVMSGRAGDSDSDSGPGPGPALDEGRSRP